jgi:integrase
MATVRSATARFLGDQASIHTRRRYKKDIMTWQRWCGEFGVHPLDGSVLNATMFLEWMEDRYTRSSVLSRFSGVSRWFDYLLEHGVIKGHGFRNVAKPSRDRRPRSFQLPSEDELLALMDTAAKLGPRWEWLAGMVAYCGLDCAEALRIKSTDVRTWEGRTLVKVVSRRGNAREVPLDGRLEIVTLGLAGVFAPTTPLGPPLTSEWASQRLRALSREATGRTITVQDLRRHAVLRQAERGVPVNVIARWLGHTTDQWVRETLGMVAPVAEVTQADVLEAILVASDEHVDRAPDSLIDGGLPHAG